MNFQASYLWNAICTKVRIYSCQLFCNGNMQYLLFIPHHGCLYDIFQDLALIPQCLFSWLKLYVSVECQWNSYIMANPNYITFLLYVIACYPYLINALLRPPKSTYHLAYLFYIIKRQQQPIKLPVFFQLFSDKQM